MNIRTGMDFVAKSRVFTTKRLAGIAIVALAVLPLPGCIGYDGTVQRGYQLDPATLQQVKPGESAEKVLQILGTPSTTSTVGGDAWYYISQTVKRPVAFLPSSVTDQRVLAVYFDKGKKVQRLANYGMQDGVLFDFISRTTPVAGGDTSFVQQMITGVLKFSE